MNNKIFDQVNVWIHRNARELELAQWEYFFENGTKEAVLKALQSYQNPDGGFGHALEADNWNPNSSPITTQQAIKILNDIDFHDLNHPIYQGIFTYLNSEKDLLSYGWRFTIPTNDEYPHAPWWNYNEEQNKNEYYGVTAVYASFILLTFPKDSLLYQKALTLANELIELMMGDGTYGDMGIECFLLLADTMCKKNLTHYDHDEIWNRLFAKVKNAIEHDTSKWIYYVARPSNYITSPDSVLYAQNKEITDQEVQYLITTFPEDGVWPITWTWFDNMAKYEKQFTVSENWWKASKAIEKMRFLQAFGAFGSGK